MSFIKLGWLRSQAGASMVEAVIALVIFAVGVLSMGAGGALGLRQAQMGRRDMHQWAMVQTKIDSLVSVGGVNIASGSEASGGYTLTWTVTGTNPRRVDIVTTRPSLPASPSVPDTVVFYLTNP